MPLLNRTSPIIGRSVISNDPNDIITNVLIGDPSNIPLLKNKAVGKDLIIPNPNVYYSSDNPYNATTHLNSEGYGSIYLDGSAGVNLRPTNKTTALPNFTYTGPSGSNIGNNATIEFWIKLLEVPVVTDNFILSSSNANSGALFNVRITIAAQGAGKPAGGINIGSTSAGANPKLWVNASLSLNTWTHVALVVTDNVMAVYYNGVSQSLTLNGGNTGWLTLMTTGASYDLNFGGAASGGTYTTTIAGQSGVGCYISDLRITMGNAVYSGDFNVPTKPLSLTNNANTPLSNVVFSGFNTYQPINNHTFFDRSPYPAVVRQGSGLTPAITGPKNIGEIVASTMNPYGENWSILYKSGGNGNDWLEFSPTVPLESDKFTIEFWMYPFDNTSGSQYIVGQNYASTAGYPYIYISSTGLLTYQSISTSYAIQVQKWQHVAIVREGTGANLLKIYLDGVLAATGTDSTTWTKKQWALGGYLQSAFSGYISNFRITKGDALYANNFTPSKKPLAPLSNTIVHIASTNRLTDQSLHPANLAYSSTTVSTSGHGNFLISNFSPFDKQYIRVDNNKYGYASKYFDPYFGHNSPSGVGRVYLTLYDSLSTTSNYNFGTGDFTVEAWVNVEPLFGSGLGGIIWGTSISDPNKIATASGPGWFFYVGTGGSLYWDVRGMGTAIALTSGNNKFSAGKWTHVAATRTSSTLRLFANGVQVASQADTNNYASPQHPFAIGGSSAGNVFTFPGYISNLRVIKGTSLYNGAFNPPTSPLTSITNTVLLTLVDNTLKDYSTTNANIRIGGHVITTGHNPFGQSWDFRPVNYSPNVHGGSVYFGGKDFIHATLDNKQKLSAAFTMQGWMYPTAKETANLGIAGKGQNPTAGWEIYVNTSNSLVFAYSGVATGLVTGSKINFNAWNHFAVTRDRANTTSVFLNGNLEATTVVTNLFNQTSANIVIGGSKQQSIGQSAANIFTGYIADFHIEANVCRYSNSFLVPTTTTSPGANTVFYLDAKPAIGDLRQSTTFITYSNIALISRSPFRSDFDYAINAAATRNSTVYDRRTGTGSYLKTANTSTNFNLILRGAQGGRPAQDFTLEAWVYPLSLSSSAKGIFTFGPDSNISRYSVFLEGEYLKTNKSGAITANLGYPALLGNTWSHVAIVRSSNGIVSGYVNGIKTSESTTEANSLGQGDLIIGANVDGTQLFDGYIKDVRIITSNVAKYTSSFSLSNKVNKIISKKPFKIAQ